MLRALLVFAAVAAAGPEQLHPPPRRPGFIYEHSEDEQEPRASEAVELADLRLVGGSGAGMGL